MVFIVSQAIALNKNDVGRMAKSWAHKPYVVHDNERCGYAGAL